MLGRVVALLALGACYSPSHGPDGGPVDGPDGGRDGAVDDAPPPPPFTCPISTVFRDDFSNAVIEAPWGPYTGLEGVLSEDNGQTVMGFEDASVTAGSYAGMQTSSFDLLMRDVVAEVIGVSKAENYLIVSVDLDNRLAVLQEGDGLVCRQRLAGVQTDLASRSYDPENDRFWMIRELSGMVYCETSPDGMEWAVLGSGPRLIDLRSAVVLLEVDSPAQLNDPGETRYEMVAVCGP